MTLYGCMPDPLADDMILIRLPFYHTSFIWSPAVKKPISGCCQFHFVALAQFVGLKC